MNEKKVLALKVESGPEEEAEDEERCRVGLLSVTGRCQSLAISLLVC